MSSDSGAPRGLGRVRSFVGGRSATQRIGVVAAAAVLVTAPFGGLKENENGAYGAMHLKHRYDIGPFYLTIDKVVTLSDLLPAIKPQKKGDRLLVIEITLTNHVDQPQTTQEAVDTIGGDHTGAIPWPEDVAQAKTYGSTVPTTAEPKVFNVADATQMQGTEPINPGTTYQLAIVVEQAPGWDPKDFTLSLQGLVYQEDDPLAIEGPSWVQRTYVARGHVDVEVKS